MRDDLGWWRSVLSLPFLSLKHWKVRKCVKSRQTKPKERDTDATAQGAGARVSNRGTTRAFLASVWGTGAGGTRTRTPARQVTSGRAAREPPGVFPQGAVVALPIRTSPARPNRTCSTAGEQRSWDIEKAAGNQW